MNEQNEKCVVCNKEILCGDIFTKVEMDMHRLIYNEFEGEENFLRVPDGAVHSKVKFYLCDSCSNGLLTAATKDIAVATVEAGRIMNNIDGGSLRCEK